MSQADGQEDVEDDVPVESRVLVESLVVVESLVLVLGDVLVVHEPSERDTLEFDQATTSSGLHGVGSSLENTPPPAPEIRHRSDVSS